MTDDEFRSSGMTKEEMTAILERLRATKCQLRRTLDLLSILLRHLKFYSSYRREVCDKVGHAVWALGLAWEELEDAEDEVSLE